MYTHTTMNTAQSKARTAFKYFTLTQANALHSSQWFSGRLRTWVYQQFNASEFFIPNCFSWIFLWEFMFVILRNKTAPWLPWGVPPVLILSFWDWKMTALHNWKSPYLPPHFWHLKQMQGYISQTCASTTAPSLCQT